MRDSDITAAGTPTQDSQVEGSIYFLSLVLPGPSDIGALREALGKEVLISLFRGKVPGFTIPLRPKVEGNQGAVREGAWVL